MTETPGQSANRLASSSDRFDPSLRELVLIMWQRRGVACLVFVAVLTVLLGLISNWKQDYRAVAEIGLMSAPPFSERAMSGGLDSPRIGFTAQQIETVIAEIRGQETLATALSVLRGENVTLAMAPESGGLLAQIMSQVMQPAKRHPVRSDEIDMFNRLRGAIEAERVGNAAVVELGFTAHDPVIAQKALTAITESYVWQREDRQKQTVRTELSEASRQFEAAKSELFKLETDLARWQQQAGVLDEGEGKLMLDRIYALDEQTEKLGQEVAGFRVAAKLRSDARDLDALLTIANVASHPVVRQLSLQLDRKKQELIALDQRYGPKHPIMQGKVQELEDARSELSFAVENVVDQLALELASAEEKLRLVSRQRDEWQRRMTERNARLQGQAALLRSVALARDEVQELGQRVQGLRRKMAGFRGDVEILRAPTTPTVAEFPNKRDLTILAVMIALFAAISAVLLRHYFDQTIHDDFDAESQLGIPLYARIPDDRGADKARDEAFGHLAVLMRILDQKTVQGGIKKAQVITMGSASTGDGKTHIARALAAKLSELGANVILIDADLHDPAAFGGQGERGDLTTVLAGDCALDQAICAVDGMHYLGARMAVPGQIATGLIESRLEEIVTKLRAQFDHIIIDTPPVLAVADGVLAARLADVSLFAARCGHSNQRDITDALDQLRTAGVVPDGVVLNNARPRLAYGKATSTQTAAEQG